MRRLTWLSLLTGLALPVFAQDPVPSGGEVQVNTYTTSVQDLPSVGVASGGGFVVVWRSNGSDGDDNTGYSIQGRRFASDGMALDVPFQVNTYTTSNVDQPAVGVGPNGHFVVVWKSTTPFPDVDFSVQGRRYAPGGTALGVEFKVVEIPGDPKAPSVGVDSAGDFVVVWEDSPSGEITIQGRRFAADGSGLGSQFQVESLTTGNQKRPSVSVEPDGDFVVVWESDVSGGSDSEPTSIQGRRFASDGTERGSQFQVNTYTSSVQASASVSVEPDGDFVVVWQSLGSGADDDSDESIQAQRFASDGTQRGGELQVNSFTLGYQFYPAVAVDSDGDFVVVWESDGSAGDDTSGYSVQVRRYASDGAELGGELQVNSFTPDQQYDAGVGADAFGNFVVVWTSYGSGGDDSDNYSIQSQRYVPCDDADGDGLCADVDCDDNDASNACHVFSDGFESGSVSMWSSSAGG